jgi:hypothetical protein
MAIGVMDKYVWKIKNSTTESLRCFCWMIKEVFKPMYLRQPTKKDFER